MAVDADISYSRVELAIAKSRATCLLMSPHSFGKRKKIMQNKTPPSFQLLK